MRNQEFGVTNRKSEIRNKWLHVAKTQKAQDGQKLTILCVKAGNGNRTRPLSLGS